MASSTTKTPLEQVNSKLSSLRMKLQPLQASARLSYPRDQVEDISTQVNGLRSRIEDLRRRGYVFGKGHESQASRLVIQWRPLREKAVREIERQAPKLEQELSAFEKRLAQVQARAANPAAVQSTLGLLETEIDTFEDRVRAVANNIGGMYDSFSVEAHTMKTELDRIDWMLEQFAQATFRLLPTEGAIMAVKAVFSKDEKVSNDDPEGVLYLTDQRLFFEQKQEVATKKVLFITTQKELVHKLLLEAPVDLVEQVQASKKGLFGNEDHLEIAFKPGVAVYAAWFHIDGQDCRWWQGLIGQARSHEFDDDRVISLEKEMVDKVRSAPSQCPNCGAPVNQVVLRGMDSITCAYCQQVMRL